MAYEPFAQAAIAALEEHRLAAREALIGAQLDTGLHGELVPQLEELIADNPYRERLREQLVLRSTGPVGRPTPWRRIGRLARR